MVAHELTHALDDQVVNLDSLLASRERTEDGEFVVGALIEGSATALMTQYAFQRQLAGELSLEDLRSLTDLESDRTRRFLDNPPYFHVFLAQYSAGMTFLLAGDLAAVTTGGVTSGIRLLAALRDPPRSSEQILHPEKYWDPELRDPPVVVDDEEVRRLAEAAGYRVAARNTAGEVLLGILCGSREGETDPVALFTGGWTHPGSEGWGGDRFYLLEREDPRRRVGTGEEAGLWILLWDTPEDRDEFEEACDPGERAPGFPLGRRGAVRLFGMDPETAAGIERSFRENPPRFTRGDAVWPVD
jgi:hypothetical protein